MKKILGFVLALALCGALSLAVVTKASAATTILINATSDWALYAPSGSLTLNNGDVLYLGSASGSPSSATTIKIAANANATIVGNSVMRTNLCIADSSADTASHTVTIDNLRITAPAHNAAYLVNSGVLELVGLNVLASSTDGAAIQSVAPKYSVNINSTVSGKLSVSSLAGSGYNTIDAITLSVKGNASVSVMADANGTAVYVRDTVTVDTGASLTATATIGQAIRGVNLVVENFGTVIISGGANVMPLYGTTVTVKMGGDAITKITTQFGKAYAFVMIPASGYQWQVSGSAFLVAPSNIFSSPATISFPVSTTGSVKLEPVPPPPTTPVLPMLRFTESTDMTGDGLGDTLAVDSWGYLWVFPGSVTGQFGTPVSRIGSGFSDLLIAAPGDVNSDGRADVLAIDNDGTLWLYAGNGSKQLSTRKQVGNGWTGWRLIPAGDLTGDKKADLLSIDSNGDLYMYAGKGDGTFGMKKKVGNGWTGWDLFSAGDLNGDGKTDILGINSVGDLYQYAGKGDGTFQMKVKAGNGWVGYTLAAGGDLNGDGKADILGLDKTTHTLYVYLGKGNAQFAMKKQIATGW